MNPGQPWTNFNQAERIIFGNPGFVVVPCNDAHPYGWGRPLSTITVPGSKTSLGTSAGGGFPQVFIPVHGIHDKFDYAIGTDTPVEAGNSGIFMGGKLVSWDSPFGCGILGNRMKHTLITGVGDGYTSQLGQDNFINATPPVPEGEVWTAFQANYGSACFPEFYQMVQSYKIYQGGKLLSWITSSDLGTPQWGVYTTTSGQAGWRFAFKNFNLNGLGAAYNPLAGYELSGDGQSSDEPNAYDAGRGLDNSSNNYDTLVNGYVTGYVYNPATTIAGEVDKAYIFKYRIGCAYLLHGVLICILVGDESIKVLSQHPVGGGGWTMVGTFDMTGGVTAYQFRGATSDVQVTKDGLNFLGLASYAKLTAEQGVCIFRGQLSLAGTAVTLDSVTTEFRRYTMAGTYVADSNPYATGYSSQNKTTGVSVPIACGYNAANQECFLTETVTAYTYSQVNSNEHGWYALLPYLTPVISGTWYTTGVTPPSGYTYIGNTYDQLVSCVLTCTLSKEVAGSAAVMNTYTRTVTANTANAYQDRTRTFSGNNTHCKVLFVDFKNDVQLLQEGSITESVTHNVAMDATLGVDVTTVSRSLSITDQLTLWVAGSSQTLFTNTQTASASPTGASLVVEHLLYSKAANHTEGAISPIQEGIPWFDYSNNSGVSGFTLPTVNGLMSRPKSYAAKNQNSYMVQFAYHTGLSFSLMAGYSGSSPVQFLAPVFSDIGYADFKIDVKNGVATVTNNPVSSIGGATRARAKHDCYRDQDMRGPCIKII